MSLTLRDLKEMYEKLDPITPKAIVLSPESEEEIIKLLGIKKISCSYVSSLGIKVFINPYLGRCIFFGEEDRLKELGLIPGGEVR